MIVQNPFRMGYESVKAIGMKLKDETPPRYIDSGVTKVTRANVEKPDIVQLLKPEINTWLSGPGR
jgi:ribose transport system substrate-binding protein